MKTADEIEIELGRIREKLADPPQLKCSALYAAQQALSWVLDADTFQAPHDAIIGTSAASEGC